MMNTNRSSFKLSMLALTLVLPGTFGIRTWGQKAPPITVGDKKITGVPEDWSFHHIVFPNPGPEENAIRNGTQKKWLGIVNDPRYVLQQLQRRSPAEGPAAAAVSNWLNDTDENAKKGAPSPSKTKTKTKIDKDWTMILGNGSAAASLIGTIGTVSSSTVSGSSTLTIDGQTFTASAPTSATSTGTFSGFPTSTTAPTITVNGGGQTITLTTNATAKTATGTITAGSPGAPLTGKTIVVPSNAGSIALTPGGSPATLTGSVSAAVSSGTIQVAYNNGGGAANTLSLTPATGTQGKVVGTFTASNTSSGQFLPGKTASTWAVTSASTVTLTPDSYGWFAFSGEPCVGFFNPSNSCFSSDEVTIGTSTYTFSTGTGSTRDVLASSAETAGQNLAAAIMGNNAMCSNTPSACYGSNTTITNVTGSYDATNNIMYIFNGTGSSLTITITRNTLGVITSSGSSIAAGSNTCSGTAGTFIATATTSTGSASAAANILSSLTSNSSSCLTTLGMTAADTATTVTLTNTVPGSTPAVSSTENLGGFAAVATQGTGTAGCTSSTTGTFGTYSGITAANQASNISAAISSCDSSFPAVGATSSYSSGTTFTVTAAAPGSAVTLTGSSSASGFTWSSSTVGNDTGAGTCTSGTAGTFVNSGVANTLAANIYNTLTNSSCTTTFPSGVTATHASNTNTFTVTANVLGGSPAFTTTGSTATIISWGSVTGGSAGTTGCSGSGSGPWTATFMTGTTTTATAANVTSAIDACSGASATITASGSVTVSTAVPGTGSTLTVASNNMSIFAWGAVTAGTNGTDSSTTFAYWSGSAYDTPSQLATDLATAVADNATVTAVITAAANSPSSGNVTFTANTAGTGGNNYEVSAGSFSAFSPTSANLSGGGSGGLELNAYPAKYSFSTATASCSDYVVYPTGLDGGTGQASVVAYSNLYVNTTCTNIGPVPSIYFAYNTPVDGNSSAAASLSPVLSLDGTQVAYVEVANGVASLVILRMANSGGTIANPVGINYETPGSYSGCSAPCYTTLTFDGNPNDTNSSPFVNYFGSNSDLYVGDNSGKVHHFTGVFSGNPAESTGSGWPVSVSSNTLTGVVFDQSNSFLYVGDSGGFLYSINTSNRAVVTSGQIATGNGIVDAPLIDSAPSIPTVYAFVGDDTSARSGVYQFAANFASGTKGAEANMGTSSGSTSTTAYDGAFDNLHYDIASGTGGSLYVCAGYPSNPLVPQLYRITMSSFTATPATVGNGPAIGSASCSPVTEFLGSKANTTLSAAINNSTTTIPVASGTGIANNDYIQIDSEIMKVASGGGTTTLTVGTRGGTGALGTAAASHPINEAVQDIQDWAYLGVTANGNDTGCTSSAGVPGCLFNYSITTGPPSAAATGVSQTGGTSGIIIDNLSTAAGASQIYFNSLGIESCAGNTVTGGGSGGCAVQASQSVP